MTVQDNQFPILNLPNKNFFYIEHLQLIDSDMQVKMNQKFLTHANALFFSYSDNEFGLYKISLFDETLKKISEILTKNNNILLIIGSIFDNMDLFNNQELYPNIILCKNETIVNCNGKKFLCLSGGINKESCFIYNIYQKLFELNQHCFDVFDFDKIKDVFNTETDLSYLDDDIDAIVSPVMPNINLKDINKELRNYIQYSLHENSKNSNILPLWMHEYDSRLREKVSYYIKNLKKDNICLISGDIVYGSINELNFNFGNKKISWYNNSSKYNEILVSALSQKGKKKKIKMIN